MYRNFFSLREKPFMLAPNPAYLYLGQSHEEALAHLIYAVSEGEGFISLIGKRGVGKTTICQAFVARLKENTTVAYIFKPEVRPAELLKKINSEFSIRADTEDIKVLIDELNSFLMQQRVAGKKVVLFIDDAQKLKSDVLEQVRLLSNLETTREKLLQIVLVGEPELADMLGSRALRQIGQRVSVSYHIGPLTFEETCAYIHHRLRVASLEAPPHFEASALKKIYKFSGGVPRMINIACEKSLATAHRLTHSHITGEIAKTAILDLSGMSGWGRPGFTNKRRTLLVTGGCGLVAILLMAAFYPRPAVRQAGVSMTGARPAVANQPDGPKVIALPGKAVEPPGKLKPARMPQRVQAGKADVISPVAAAPDPALETPPKGPAKMTHSVQVGAFRARQQAVKLMATLKNKGYPAGILSVTDSRQRTWYTVRIGDYPSRAAAIQRANEFSAREKMRSAVRPFEKL